MRWGIGLIAITVAILCWLGTMVADPYTTMGIGPQYLRPSVAVISMRFAAACLALVSGAALIVYTEPDNRRGWRAIVFAIALGFLGWTALARLVWVAFVVLG